MSLRQALQLAAVAVFSFGPQVIAASCTSRLIACFAFPTDSSNNNFDYELMYDQIPDGSIGSICSSLSTTFGNTKGLGNPGCRTQNNLAQGGLISSNTVVLSTRMSGSPNFDLVTNTFQSTLQCDIQTLDACTLQSVLFPDVSTSRVRRGQFAEIAQRQDDPTDLIRQGGLMSAVGNQLLLAGNLGLITLKIIVTSAPTITFPEIVNSNDVAVAVQSLSRTIVSDFTNGIGPLDVFEAPIGVTGQTVKVLVDFGINQLSQAQAALVAASDWHTLINGLCDGVSETTTGMVAGAYSLSDSVSSLDIFITAAVGIPLPQNS
jgi:hypothetical protein